MKENKTKIILTILIVTAFLFRFIGNIPEGATNDEANYAYDAFLLSQTGMDQWGEFLPLQFRGFGDYRLPVYQYLLVPVVKFFGMETWTIRLPTVIFSSLTLLALYLLISVVFKNSKKGRLIGLLAAFLIVFNPWHFGLSRIIMEANVGAFFVLMSLYFLFKGEKNLKYFFLSLILAVLSFYTYYGYRVFLPLIFIYLALCNKNLVIYKFRKKFLLAVFTAVLLIPLIFALFQGGGVARFNQVNLFKDVSTVGQVNQLLGVCQQNLPSLACKIFLNKYAAFFTQFFTNYFNHFSPQFLFFTEFEKGWGFIPPAPYFYLVNLPFFFLGLVKLLRKKEGHFFLIFLLLAPLADSLTGKGHYARSFILIIPVVVFTAFGWYWFFNFLKNTKGRFLSLIPVAVYFYFIGQFLLNYFVYFPKKHSIYTYYPYKPLFSFLKEAEKNYQNFYISRELRDTKQYIFYLYYNKIPADKYFAIDRDYYIEEDGWVKVERLGNYHFLDSKGDIMSYPANSLLALAPKTIKTDSKPVKIIYYKDGKNIAFLVYDVDSLKQELEKEKKLE
jgi:4-amino-4-deoxy-L-arabinose transferase-like glycosyltransferase